VIINIQYKHIQCVRGGGNGVLGLGEGTSDR
jgi:hypothetical protein